LIQTRHAVAVLIVTPQGIPLILDPAKKPPYWKAPGGRSSREFPGETAKKVAIREVEEEVGIQPQLSESELIVVVEEPHPTHTRSLFVGHRATLAGIKKRGDDGEIVKVFSVSEILALPNFFEPHRIGYGKILCSL